MPVSACTYAYRCWNCSVCCALKVNILFNWHIPHEIPHESRAQRWLKIILYTKSLENARAHSHTSTNPNDIMLFPKQNINDPKSVERATSYLQYYYCQQIMVRSGKIFAERSHWYMLVFALDYTRIPTDNRAHTHTLEPPNKHWHTRLWIRRFNCVVRVFISALIARVQLTTIDYRTDQVLCAQVFCVSNFVIDSILYSPNLHMISLLFLLLFVCVCVCGCVFETLYWIWNRKLRIVHAAC